MESKFDLGRLYKMKIEDVKKQDYDFFEGFYKVHGAGTYTCDDGDLIIFQRAPHKVYVSVKQASVFPEDRIIDMIV